MQKKNPHNKFQNKKKIRKSKNFPQKIFILGKKKSEYIIIRKKN